MTTSECYEPHPEQAAGEIIEGEAVVINLATGVYYSLNGVAGEIWRMVTERLPVTTMVEELTSGYDVDAETAARDVRRVLEELAGEGLVRPAAAGAVRAASAATGLRGTYVPPEIEIYRDMQDLLALDPPSPGLTGVVWKKPTEPA